VTAGLVIGSIPLFLGLIVVLPVLGHATWHLYRRTVVVEPQTERRWDPARGDVTLTFQGSAETLGSEADGILVQSVNGVSGAGGNASGIVDFGARS
jgi:hypothetical protein